MNDKPNVDAARVLISQERKTRSEIDRAKSLRAGADVAIQKAEGLLSDVGARTELQIAPSRHQIRTVAPELRNWSDILADARDIADSEISSLLSVEEAASVRAQMRRWSSQFSDIHRLTATDYALAAIAGSLAGIADIVLVQIPAQKGLLGGKRVAGGVLSRAVKERLNKLLPESTIKRLERKYPVPFDVHMNRGLDTPVPGLNPRSHRLSPSHDPLLAWLFGTRDVMASECTMIDRNGKVTVLPITNSNSNDADIRFFVKLLSAMKQVAGHLLSDVSTPAGLPPPLFSLLLLIQTGSLRGPRGQVITIAEMARVMYRKGYDFRHFLAGGICTALIEALVRAAWVVREFVEGRTLEEIVPLGKQRLNSTLFLAHSIAAGINAGKIGVTQNILSLNYAQWLAFAHYLMKQTIWICSQRETDRQAYVRAKLDTQWGDIDDELNGMWSVAFQPAP